MVSRGFHTFGPAFLHAESSPGPHALSFHLPIYASKTKDSWLEKIRSGSEQVPVPLTVTFAPFNIEFFFFALMKQLPRFRPPFAPGHNISQTTHFPRHSSQNLICFEATRYTMGSIRMPTSSLLVHFARSLRHRAARDARFRVVS